MKKNLILGAICALFLTALSACSGNSKGNADDTADILTVDSVMVALDSFVGKTVTIEGVVSHLCKHGGRKAFILGGDDNTMLRADATPEMGGAFPQECIHKPVKVTGVIVEERLDEAAVREMEANHAAMQQNAEAQGDTSAANKPTGCDTERKAAGQAEIESFTAQMADYRARIADRNAKEGKPYLSFYSMKASAYEILPE